MLNQLESLAADLGLPFAYGTRAELNVLADGHRTGPLLFHEGYLESDVAVTNQGGFRRTHVLVLYVLVPSLLSDKPEIKRDHRDYLLGIANSVVYRLDALTSSPFSMRQSMFQTLNLTDRNLDGIKLTGSLTLIEIPTC